MGKCAGDNGQQVEKKWAGGLFQNNHLPIIAGPSVCRNQSGQPTQFPVTFRIDNRHMTTVLLFDDQIPKIGKVHGVNDRFNLNVIFFFI